MLLRRQCTEDSTMNLDYYNEPYIPVEGILAIENQSDKSEDSSRLCLLELCSDQMQPGVERTEFKRRVYGLIGQLDSDLFRERETAHTALLGMDRSVLPLFERELRNPRSAEVASRLRTIYRTISGSEQVQFQGNIGRDGTGRLREIRDNMTITYVDGAFPNRNNQIDTISYPRAGGWSIVRQGDGTYNIYQAGNDGQPMTTGASITIDQATGNVRVGQINRDNTSMIIPPAGPRWWYHESDTAPPRPDDN
jgi:hypothetical protein